MIWVKYFACLANHSGQWWATLSRLDVPILSGDLTGFTVRSHHLNVYDRGDVPLPLGTVPPIQAIPSQIDNPDEPLEGYRERRPRLATPLLQTTRQADGVPIQDTAGLPAPEP